MMVSGNPHKGPQGFHLLSTLKAGGRGVYGLKLPGCEAGPSVTSFYGDGNAKPEGTGGTGGTGCVK